LVRARLYNLFAEHPTEGPNQTIIPGIVAGIAVSGGDVRRE